MTWRYAENVRPKFPSPSILGRINSRTWSEINRLWTTTDYRSDQVILAAEEQTSDVCFLLLGTARVTVFTESGREVSFLILGPGDCFGEFSAIDLEPRSASVVASSDCTAARLSAAVFRDLVKGNTDMAFALASVLVGKLRTLSQRISDFNAMSADQRVRQEVVRLAQAHRRGTDSALLDHPPTQTDLAAYVFTNREGVAREMGRMKRAGVLERRGRGLYVPSVAALERYVAEAG